ncbi:PREDICTED: 40S ribosomal protein S21-1-like [Camelina sativa]|uniref:40S ribosomal protein S21-1-like n=1 Tax=Camelina sativa TaxID=90675 RepID=A0ABM0ZC41_CAMSA|nr:PREDICTED: 40S ribosomal protein S21-1-like [Camelina sativa]
MELKNMESEKVGVGGDAYRRRSNRWSLATNRLITSKDHASVQLNIGHLDADGVYTGQFTTFALCGFVRAQGDADSGVDRLWQKKKVEAKQQ